jgi:hypothetical protein
MPYKIMCWIPVEEDEPEIYKTRKEARKGHYHLSLMQPENIYKIVPATPEAVARARKSEPGA